MTKKIYFETLKSVLGRSASHYFAINLTFFGPHYFQGGHRLSMKVTWWGHQYI